MGQEKERVRGKSLRRDIKKGGRQKHEGKKGGQQTKPLLIRIEMNLQSGSRDHFIGLRSRSDQSD